VELIACLIVKSTVGVAGVYLTHARERMRRNSNSCATVLPCDHQAVLTEPDSFLESL
jgi:hypothetical protein